jgi:hypothetical protein
MNNKDNYIIYPNANNSITLLMPSNELPLIEIARKDVPKEVPYLIITKDSIPDDDEYFNAWEADFSNPDGYGIGADAWFAEQEALNDNN